MSNSYSGTTWVLDTAATISTNTVWIDSMEWIPSAAADDLTITDGSGNVEWDVDALTGGTPGKEKPPWTGPRRMQGFIVSVIDGGTLYVYTK